MCAAAEFTADVVHRHHSHDVGVFLTEKHHRPGVASLRQGEELGRYRHRGQDRRVHHALNLFKRLLPHWLAVGKVEPHRVGIDLRALLHGMGAEEVLQGGM